MTRRRLILTVRCCLLCVATLGLLVFWPAVAGWLFTAGVLVLPMLFMPPLFSTTPPTCCNGVSVPSPLTMTMTVSGSGTCQSCGLSGTAAMTGGRITSPNGLDYHKTTFLPCTLTANGVFTNLADSIELYCLDSVGTMQFGMRGNSSFVNGITMTLVSCSPFHATGTYTTVGGAGFNDDVYSFCDTADVGGDTITVDIVE